MTLDPSTMKEQLAVCLKREDWSLALGFLQQLSASELFEPEWPLAEADIHLKQGAPHRAIAALRLGAQIFAENGSLLRAIAVYKRILALDPDHSETQAMLARLYARRGHPRASAAGDTEAAGLIDTSENKRRGAAAAAEETTPPPLVQVKNLPAEITATAPRRPRVGEGLLRVGASLDSIRLRGLLPGRQREKPVQVGQGRFFEVELDEFDSAWDEMLRGSPARTTAHLPPTPLFSSLDPQALRSIIERAELKHFLAGARIVEQGDAGDWLFVLVEGEVAVYQEGPPRVELKRLSEGAFLGEIALLTEQRRTATVEALSDTSVLVISREIIGELIERHPEVLTVMLRFFRSRLVNTLLETSYLFAPFTDEEREELASIFTFIEVEPGTALIRAGTKSVGLYLLLCGQLDVTQEEPDAQPPDADLLKPGSLFGALSLITATADRVTVTARTKCWLLFLGQEIFKQVVIRFPQMSRFIQGLVEAESIPGDSEPENTVDTNRTVKIRLPIV